VHSVASDRLTDHTSLPEPSGRQSGDLGEKWQLEFCEGSFTCRKSTTWDRRKWCTGFLSPIALGRDRTCEPWVQWRAR
jgi:hypothetical protein